MDRPLNFNDSNSRLSCRHTKGTRQLAWTRVQFDDTGDTLIEVLITLVVLSLCGVALIAAFQTATLASSSYRSVATINNVIANASQDVIAQLQQQSSPGFSNLCPSPTHYNSILNFAGTSGYSVLVTGVKFWNGSSFGSSCTAPSTATQLIDLGASPVGSTATPTTFNVVIDARGYAAATSITTPTSGLSATIGTNYSLFIASSVASTPGSYASTGSALPPGLSVRSSTGDISGTPTTVGTYAGIVITVTDQVGTAKSTGPFQIKVFAAPTISTPTLGLTATAGTAYTLPITSTVADTPGAFTSTGAVLPPGLSVNSSTGTISGTPTTAGTYAGIVVTVTDNAGANASTNIFSIHVQTASLSITSVSPLTFQKNKTNPLTIVGTGFTNGATATVACTNSVTTATPSSITSTQIVVNVTTPSSPGTSFTCTVTTGGATSNSSQNILITN
jgi:Tfp pilus assembly protein PilV